MKPVYFLILILSFNACYALRPLRISLGAIAIIAGTGILAHKDIVPVIRSHLTTARKNYLKFIGEQLGKPSSQDAICIDASGDYEPNCHQEWWLQSRLFVYNSLYIIFNPHQWFIDKKK